MSVCAGKRKALALLAVNALEGAEAEELRAHVESCAECREYLREIGQVSSRLEAASTLAAMAPSPLLRRRMRQALERERPQPSVFWRLIFPAALAMFFVLVVLPRMKREPQPEKGAAPGSSGERTVTMEKEKGISPTLLNYQMAANASFDKLDRVLAAQAREAAPAGKVYRAGNWVAE